MNTIYTFITSPVGQIFSYIFGFFGFISAIITFISYKRTKHIKMSNKYIINLLHQGIDNISKSQIEELNQELSKIQSAIKEQIPYEAKRAALNEKLNWQLQEFYAQYDAILDTRDKLKKLDNELPINDNLAKLIENEIEPQYLITKQFNLNRDLLLVLASLSLVLPFFNPILCAVAIIPLANSMSYFLEIKFNIEKKSNTLSFTIIATFVVLGYLLLFIID